MTLRRRVPAVAALIATGLLLGACSEAKPETGREDSAGAPERTADASVFEVRAGDCLIFPDGAESLRSLTAVPCPEPHDAEAFHELTVDGEQFPGDTQVAAVAEEACVAAFQTFVGVPYSASALEFDYLAPSQESWDTIGDRTVSCLIFDPANLTSTGTLEGAAR